MAKYRLDLDWNDVDSIYACFHGDYVRLLTNISVILGLAYEGKNYLFARLLNQYPTGENTKKSILSRISKRVMKETEVIEKNEERE